jgi:putative transposase
MRPAYWYAWKKSSAFSKGVLWSPSYFAASAGGAPLEKVKQYVEAQRS